MKTRFSFCRGVFFTFGALSFILSNGGAAPFSTFDHETKLVAYGRLAMSGNTVAIDEQVFARTPNAWIRQASFPQYNIYGVALDGDTLLLAPNLYVRSGSTWTLQNVPPPGGSVAAIRSNTLAFAWGATVQVWERTAPGWRQNATLGLTNPVYEWNNSLAMDGDTIVTGEWIRPHYLSNAVSFAYVFARRGTNWTQEATLLGDARSSPAVLESFGTSVAISGNTIAVGDPGDNSLGNSAGAVYVFVRSGTNWGLQQKIVPQNASGSNSFGQSVSISGDLLVVGAPGVSPGWSMVTGLAHVYARDGTTWFPLQTLRGSDSVPGDGFGRAVAMGTNAIVVTSYRRMAYVFEPESSAPLLPGVDVAADGYFFSENGAVGGSFIITRIGATNSTLTVRYTVSGTAESGIDYETLPGVVTIPPGAESVEVPVKPLEDRHFEGTETITLSLSPDPGYEIGYQAGDTLQMADDEPQAIINVSATDAEAAEEIPPAPGTRNTGSFTITRSGETNEPLTVYFAVSGTASPSDYLPLGSSIVIPAGAFSARLLVTAVDDSYIEGNETVVLTLSTNRTYAIWPTNSATITIEDRTAWLNSDIGPVGISGTGTRSNGTFHVSGGGNDIAGTSDAFHYFHRRWTGDGTLIVRVAQSMQSEAWARGGLMFRANLNADSSYALMYYRAGGRTGFQTRTGSGQDTAFQDGSWGYAPCWLKLIRRGNSFLGYESIDGTNWALVGSASSIEMPETIFVGFGVTSHRAGTLHAMAFDQTTFSSVAQIPYPPSGLKVNVDMNRFLLSWNDNSADEQSFEIEACADGNFHYGGVIGSVGSNVTSTGFGPFGSSATIFFRVSAIGPYGRSAPSDVVSATTPPLSFSDITRGTGGVVQLTIWGQYNQNCRVEASSNLVNWTPITNYLNSTGSRIITDFGGTNSGARFYRAVLAQ